MMKSISLVLIIAFIALSLTPLILILSSKKYTTTWFEGGFNPKEIEQLKAYCARSSVLLYDINIKFKPRYTSSSYVYINIVPSKYYVKQKVKEHYYTLIPKILKVYGADCLYTDLALNTSLLAELFREQEYEYEYFKPFDIFMLRIHSDQEADVIRICSIPILTLGHDFKYYLDAIVLTDRGIEMICPTSSILPSMEYMYVLLAHINNTESYIVSSSRETIIKPLIIIRPSQYTLHHAPSKYWSISFTSDPPSWGWHPYLKRFGVENWQTDYDYGLVFTWAMLSIPSTLHFSDNDLFLAWYFDKQSECSL